MSDSWPKHPDGRPKKMGEMTREERLAQFRAVGKRLEQEFNDPRVQEKFLHVLNGEKVQ